MTVASALLARVRTNINEPSSADDPQRTDAEIYAWLQDAQEDYTSRIPLDGFPELVTALTGQTSPWSTPADFIRLVDIQLSHTISGTVTEVATAKILRSNESYLSLNWIGGIGAWARIENDKVYMGPNPISATISYVKNPLALTGAGITFSLGATHEEPVVNYATMMACLKINDADADKYKALYDARVEAEIARYEKFVETR